MTRGLTLYRQQLIDLISSGCWPHKSVNNNRRADAADAMLTRERICLQKRCSRRFDSCSEKCYRLRPDIEFNHIF